jgi:hypothetical protein
LEFLDDQNELIEKFEIVEPILDPGLNYSGTPNPWLAYGMNGSLTSVAFFPKFHFN